MTEEVPDGPISAASHDTDSQAPTSPAQPGPMSSDIQPDAWPAVHEGHSMSSPHESMPKPTTSYSPSTVSSVNIPDLPKSRVVSSVHIPDQPRKRITPMADLPRPKKRLRWFDPSDDDFTNDALAIFEAAVSHEMVVSRARRARRRSSQIVLAVKEASRRVMELEICMKKMSSKVN